MGEKRKLTKRLVDVVQTSPGDEVRIWDSEVAGFVLRVFASGRRSFGLKYRVDGRQRWFTIGDYGAPWTVEEARERARAILRDAKDGLDRQGLKEEVREAETVAEVVERYLVEGRLTKPNKRDSSWRNDASLLRRHVTPLIGKQLARNLTRRHIEQLQADIVAGKSAADERTRPRGRAIVSGGPAVAAGTLRSLSAMLSWAVHQRIIPNNPATGVQKMKVASRERFLTHAEAQALLDATFQLTGSGAILETHAAIFRLLLFTGARKTEIAELEWREVDLDLGFLALPQHRSKTGQKVIPLNSAAVGELRGRDRSGIYVFPSTRGKGPTVGLFKSWSRVRGALGLDELRIHDLRHSFASFAAADGASLHMIGKALGHKNTSTTQRYAHLADDPVRAMAERIGQRFQRRDERHQGKVVGSRTSRMPHH